MKYLDAVKTVRTTKQKENFMVINLSYDFSLVLPHKDGLAIMAALVNAEQMDPTYSSRKHILPLVTTKISATTLSSRDYERYKIAALLDISVSDLERLEEEELQKDKEPPTS